MRKPGAKTQRSNSSEESDSSGREQGHLGEGGT